MTADLPPFLSSEQAKGVMDSMRLRERSPEHWSGACLWFTGADSRPYKGFGREGRLDSTSYAMLVLQRAGDGISAVWSEIRDGRRTDRRNEYTGVRYDPGLNALAFCRRGGSPDIVPVEGGMRRPMAARAASGQRRLEDFR